MFYSLVYHICTAVTTQCALYLQVKNSGHWLEFDSENRFYISEIKVPWATASSICESKLGAFLATLRSQAELDFLMKMFPADGQQVFWLGGKRMKNGFVQWVNSEPWDFHPWSVMEGTSPCLALHAHSGTSSMLGEGKYFTQSCHIEYYFLCRK